MPRGSSLEWGEFVINRIHKKRIRKPIVISYRSAIPTLLRRFPDAQASGFQYELFQGAVDAPGNDWGNSAFHHQGIDQGLGIIPIVSSGEVKANTRHVLTFNENGGL